ncbi:MAG: recombinase family protein [Clostridiales bacterium]|nr:recombinase family protein [Clostridiales bacterium]MCC8182758.1 recombinase family protein [Clostridiales bacterium]
MKKQIAMYLRLSQEDVDKKTNTAKDDSNSIVAQRHLILNHIAQNPYLSGLPRMEFCDDGFSGTNFDRPDFQKMIDLVRAGQIQIVIVKDLSRFGRDYLEVGDYLEHIFPFLGVRMISVNDHYDSENYLGNTPGMDVAFKNLVYDYYSKDLSKKVKSAMRIKQKKDGYVSCCPYGYKTEPGKKHQMVIDPETAPVVRKIFLDVIAGKSTSQVARDLNATGVLTPLEYSGVKRSNTPVKKAVWTHYKVLEILGNRKYTGCMVNHTRESRKIRDSAQRRVPEEEWYIHENAHEAIVTQEEYDAARAMLRKVTPSKRKPKEDAYPFYCAHCGRKLRRTFGNDLHFYCVTAYWDDSAELCKQVRWDKSDLEEVIRESLKAQISIMEVDARKKAQSSVNRGMQLRERQRVLSQELNTSDSDRVKSYLDYREGRITREEFIAQRARRDERLAEAKEELRQVEEEYSAYLKEQEQSEKERSIALRTGSLDDETLRNSMYDAVERVDVIDSSHIEIVWKFDDLFASA